MGIDWTGDIFPIFTEPRVWLLVGLAVALAVVQWRRPPKAVSLGAWWIGLLVFFEFIAGDLSPFDTGVVMAILAVMIVLIFFTEKINMLVWLLAWWLALFAVVRWGFTIPVPMSVVRLYMMITTGSLFAYILADTERLKSVTEPLTAFIVEKRYQGALVLVALAIPAFVGYQVYAGMVKEPAAPVFGRTVHPAPPEAITVLGQDHNLITLDNPYRPLEENDPEAYQERVADGRRVYYQNCFYCHGDLLGGQGMFAHGLNPIPTNFQDSNIIPILQESFLFWRISKGAPGLPEEAGPWDSAMPAWESFLTEDEMWNVILFLTDFTGYIPRARHEVH